MRKDVGSIGTQYPFYINNKEYYTFDNEEILSLQNDKILNMNSIVSILSNGYIFGNETLVNGINRAPWEAPSKNQNIYVQKNNWNTEEIAKKIEELLLEEIETYIKGESKIGILLSGGLDSRILAGLLRKIELDLDKDFNTEITVYNWGISNSRDVIYAKEIADRFSWKYKHFDIDSEKLKKNFYENVNLGCEVSPLHLHAMTDVANDRDADVIIAGTYGDSLGRGLFSGTHTTKLNNKTHDLNNKTGIIKSRYFNDYKESITNKRYEFIIDNNISSNVHEVDQYANYLRRMLTAPMNVIQNRKNIYQIFTTPEIYNFVLSLPKNMRNDEIYKVILKKLPSGIGQIPYAKNGKDFTQKESLVYDDYLKSSHNYGSWLRNNLLGFIKENYDIDLLYSTGIFNEGSLEKLYELWLKGKTQTSNNIDEKISYLTNLCMYIKKNKIIVPQVDYDNDFMSKNLKYFSNYFYLIIRNRLRF